MSTAVNLSRHHRARNQVATGRIRANLSPQSTDRANSGPGWRRGCVQRLRGV